MADNYGSIDIDAKIAEMIGSSSDDAPVSDDSSDSE